MRGLLVLLLAGSEVLVGVALVAGGVLRVTIGALGAVMEPPAVAAGCRPNSLPIAEKSPPIMEMPRLLT
jgi:hypothetical protein